MCLLTSSLCLQGVTEPKYNLHTVGFLQLQNLFNVAKNYYKIQVKHGGVLVMYTFIQYISQVSWFLIELINN